MALNFSVFNKFKAIDGVTKPVRNMTRATNKFGRSATRDFNRADKSASNLRRTLKTFIIGAGIIAGIALLKQGIGQVTSQFVSFDDNIIAAGARFKDIGPDVDNFTERIKGIKQAARDAGATTEFTAAQAAGAINELAKTGFKSTVAIASLGSMINLATASGEDFVQVAKMSSDLLGAFGLSADTTAKKIKSLSRLNNVLVKTVNSANVTVEDMFVTMKTVGPVAAGILGASLEEVAALTGVLANSGIKGSKAMTALKNVYLRMAAPASQARKILDALNVTLDDGKGGARSMTDVMEELGGKISGLGKLKQAKILDILFGKFAIAGGKNLMDNIKNIRTLHNAILTAGDISKRTAELMRTSLGNRLLTLNSTITEFGFKILENFEIRGKNGIDAITEAIRRLDVNPLINLLELFLGIGKSTVDLFTANKGLLALIGGLISLKLAVIALNVVVGISNVLLTVNPFVMFIVAAGAAILVLIELAKAFGMVDKISFSGIAEGLKREFERFGKILDPIFDKIIKVEKALKSLSFDKAKSFFGFGENNQTQPGPVSPTAGLNQTIREEKESRSRVSVDFSNLPIGSRVYKSGDFTGFDLETGLSGAY
jgi:TP901 family phage tail tape measure protein